MTREDSEARQRYAAAVAALPDRLRVVFLLHAVDELPFGEIAVRLGITVDQVERSLTDALIAIECALDGDREPSLET